MSGVYDQVKSLQRQEAEHRKWRETMVEHLRLLTQERDELKRENTLLKRLIGDYATEVIER